MTVRVLIADDQALFREGLATLLSVYDQIEVAGQAEHGAAAVALCDDLRPDVVLMDLNMPVLNGVAATARIREKHPDCRIIVLTTFDDDEHLFDALRAGAAGYLLKDVPSAKLVEAIEAVARGESFLQPQVTAKLLAEFNRLTGDSPLTDEAVEPLSPREREILREVASGAANKEIADRLCIAEGTVKNHISNILSKLDASSRTAAVDKARRLGWI